VLGPIAVVTSNRPEGPECAYNAVTSSDENRPLRRVFLPFQRKWLPDATALLFDHTERRTPMKHRASTLPLALGLAAIAVACGGNQTLTNSGTGGGSSALGGMNSATGGSLSSGGNTSTVAAGGIAATGGNNATGGAVQGGSATGGTQAAIGGAAQGGSATGGTEAAIGGAAQGGSATGGKAAGGASTGGAAAGGKATGGASTGGTATGGTAAGGASAGGTATGGTGTGPCDIYAAASPATPCVAAYSTTRVLSSKYNGPLYQVRKGGGAKNTGTGGTTQDIGTIAGGFADGAAQDAFCGTDTCTVSKLYDQSGKGNDLKVAPAGCYTGTASEPDWESDAKKRSLNISGHKVYALYMVAHEGYRNNTGSGMPTGSASQGIYEVADGKRIGSACCWDFGNASTDNCNRGTMNALFFGTGYWGKGAGSGPWFLADLEGGVWAGGTGASSAQNPNLPSSGVDYAFGILKTSSNNYAIRVGNAQSGTLTTGYDGALPKTLSHPGGIILGIGGDNSNSSLGTFFEGAITAGRPSDATDAAVLANVQAAKYGQ
jgi:hypothetical protein